MDCSHATAVLTWKLEERSCSACSSRTLNKSLSLMHAIFKISAEPLLMLRGSKERKNDLHNVWSQKAAKSKRRPQAKPYRCQTIRDASTSSAAKMHTD